MLIRFRTFVLLLIFIGLILYLRGLTNGFVGDDFLQIVQNTRVHSVASIPSFFAGSTYDTAGNSQITGLFYRPIMMSLYAVFYAITGTRPFLYHLVQLLLHISTTLLIFIFLRKFFSEIGAFVLSLIFLIHPGNSEAVLYIANMQDVLFVFFGMLALVLVQRKVGNFWQKYFILLLLLLSLFSKESGILFLIIVPLYTWLFDKRHFKFFIIGEVMITGIYLFFRYVVAHLYAANTSLAPIANIPLFARLMHIPLVLLYYLVLFFYPMTLRTYQHWTIQNVSFTNFWLPLAADILFFGLIILGNFWIKRKSDKSVLSSLRTRSAISKRKEILKQVQDDSWKLQNHSSRIYLFFLLWFVVGLVLHIQIIPLDATVADRWFYFPMIGLLGMLGLVVWQLKIWKQKTVRKVGFTGLIILLLLLALRTYTRIGDWQDEVTLFGHDITTPSNFIMNNAYGAALIQDRQYKKALPYVEASVNEHAYTANLNNLAIIYTAEKNYTKADQIFQKALKIGQTYFLYENYANFLLYYEDSKKALDFSKRALQVYPGSAKLWLVYGESSYFQGDRKTALQAVAKSYKIAPSNETLRIVTTIRKNQKLILLID